MPWSSDARAGGRALRVSVMKPFGRGRTQPLVRIDVRAARMVDRDELQPVDEQRLLELVGDAQLVAAVAAEE